MNRRSDSSCATGANRSPFSESWKQPFYRCTKYKEAVECLGGVHLCGQKAAYKYWKRHRRRFWCRYRLYCPSLTTKLYICSYHKSCWCSRTAKAFRTHSQLHQTPDELRSLPSFENPGSYGRNFRDLMAWLKTYVSPTWPWRSGVRDSRLSFTYERHALRATVAKYASFKFLWEPFTSTL